ncbi:MAG: hypothetical protein ACR2MW_10770 [Chthoniobacterales bacterium]
MKKLPRLIPLLLLALAGPIWAGTETQSKAVASTAVATTEEVPLNIFNMENAYVFESDLNHGGSLGKQDEIQNSIEFAHRFRVAGDAYIRAGVAYNRFDFGSTSAPVPNHLQSLAAVIGVDIMHGSDVGAFFQVRPGFYGQNDFGISSFDIPITLGRVFIVQPDKLYIFVGAYASFLRGGTPVLPLAGVVWRPCDQVQVLGVLPEPKLIYSPTKNLDLYLGGELAGGSYRTDVNNGITPHKLSGAQVDFSDYRAGVGVAYSVGQNLSVDLGAGYSIQRHFAFHRAGENYRTDPSPFLRLEIKAAF